MNIKSSALLLVLIFAFSFTSCEKDDKVDASVKGLLTSKTWTYVSASHDDPTVYPFAGLIDALLDGSTYKFDSNGNYTASLANNGSYSGTWELSADEKTLTLDTGDESDVYEITVTSSSLELKDEDGYKLTYN